MLRKYGFPLLAVMGALIALGVVFWSQKKIPPQPILYPPARSPYVRSIAATGIIEASSLNISIGCPFNEIVTKIYVIEGDRVKKGDLLFEIDRRSFEANAKAAEASLKEALIVLEDKKVHFAFYERLTDKRAVSEDLYNQAYYALREAEENVSVAGANLFKAQTDIERSVIRSPVDGEILQVNFAVGEIAPVVPFVSSQATLILMGTIDPLQLRIDIDEEDAWRYNPGARATAFVRGNANIHFPITFCRVEPYIVPKSSFTGQTVERVDTRVLQVLYRFEKKDLPIYTGQVLDIYIDADAISDSVKRCP